MSFQPHQIDHPSRAILPNVSGNRKTSDEVVTFSEP